MAGPGRPASLKVREIKHVQFHLGIHLIGSKSVSAPTMHLNNDKHNCEMYALPNNRIHVIVDGEEYFVPDSVIHYMKLEPESNDA